MLFSLKGKEHKKNTDSAKRLRLKCTALDQNNDVNMSLPSGVGLSHVCFKMILTDGSGRARFEGLQLRILVKQAECRKFSDESQ